MLALFFLVLLIVPHLSFRFHSKKETPLPATYWVEAQNRGAFQDWLAASRSASGHNFVMAPLAETRGRAFMESGAVFKVPAFPNEEEVPALNALKASLLENGKNEHKAQIRYEEFLLQNSGNTGSALKETAKHYDISVKRSEFSPQKTAGFKKKILNTLKIKNREWPAEIATDQAAVPFSAFSFKGKWRDGFDAGNTKEGEFNPLDPVAVLMMLKTGYHGYFEDEQFQAVDLRYGDGKLSLVIFLPHHDSSLEAFYEELNFENWNQWLGGFIDKQGTVRLPKFKIESLSQECCHAAVFETAEKGGKDSFRYDMTEVLGTTEIFDFNANRPFFFAVRDNETDLILLMGQYTGVSGSETSA